MSELMLPVSEVFGPTIQGEGPAAGQSVQFIRLGGCNLACLWCDTPYTWDASRFDLRAEIPMTPISAIAEKLIPGLPVVLSGGEPLLHQHTPAFRALWDHLVGHDRHAVHVETNGTVAPSAEVRQWASTIVVSPKLAHAGQHKPSQDPAPWGGWAEVPGAHLKYVVRDEYDVDEAVTRADALGMPRARVWVMPEGTTTTALLDRWATIATAAARHHINACQRLHVLAWGDRKGT